MKPKILLSTADISSENYINAVKLTGGIPDAIYCPESPEGYDGIVFCGGSDIHPSYYNEEINGSVNIDTKRDEAEFALFKQALKLNIPIMGICRGHQLINVALGGSLIQHIDCADSHIRKNEKDSVHSVAAEKGSFLFNLYGDNFYTNSSHHQAVKEIAPELIPTAFSNNICEAYEHKSLPILGFQFHPERMCFKNIRKDTVDGKHIFEAFINSCRKK